MYIFKYFSDSLIQGTEDDDNIFLLYGDEATIEGLGGNDHIVSLFGDKTINGGFGDDFMYSLSGDTVMYGDEGSGTGISVVPDEFVFTVPAGTLEFGHDVLISGNGNDKLYGDQGKPLLIIDFATSTAEAGEFAESYFGLNNQTQIWGDDYLSSGGGDDVLFGDVDNLPLDVADVDGSRSIADGAGAHAVATFELSEDFFAFGNDVLLGGAGDDFINGDMNSIGAEPGGGLAEASNGGIAETFFLHPDSIISFGDDIARGGAGDDAVYGEGLINSHVVIGGNAFAESGGQATTVVEANNLDLFFGDDHVYGDSGDDIVYGDARNYLNIVEGGTATADGAGSVARSIYEVNGTEIFYGNDYVSGGSGNDLVFGDLRDTEIGTIEGTATATNGGIAEVIVEMEELRQTFGDDILKGGRGDDRLYGDTNSFKLVGDELESSVEMIDGVERVVIKDEHDNALIWGNDVMKGGRGDDTFVFTLFEDEDTGMLAMQGFDTILDFDKWDDGLIFGNVDSLQDLEDHTWFEDAGDDTVIHFDAGGSITLNDISVASFDDLSVQVEPGAPVIV